MEQGSIGIGNPHLTSSNHQLRSIAAGVFAMYDTIGYHLAENPIPQIHPLIALHIKLLRQMIVHKGL